MDYIALSRQDRLKAWLKLRGFQLVTRRGILNVRIDRKARAAMMLWLRDDGTVAEFVGARKSHRSSALEKVMAEWNEAERQIARGPQAWLLERLAAMTDPDLQGMTDFYNRQDLALEKVGETVDRFEFKGGRVRTRQETRYTSLSVLVQTMIVREAHRRELAKREAEFSTTYGQALLA